MNAQQRHERRIDEMDAEHREMIAVARAAKRRRARARQITKEICGRRITLKRGVTYVACAPLAAFGTNGREPVTVSIMRGDDLFGPIAAFEVPNLTREGAKEFLRTFNNGRISFVGRKWTTR